MNTECTRKMLRTTLMNSSLKQLEIYNADLDCATRELTQLLEVNDNIISFQLYPCGSKNAVSIARALQTNHIPLHEKERWTSIYTHPVSNHTSKRALYRIAGNFREHKFSRITN